MRSSAGPVRPSSAIIMSIASWVTYKFEEKQPLKTLLLVGASITTILSAHQGGISIHGDDFLSLDAEASAHEDTTPTTVSILQPLSTKPQIVPYKPQIRFLFADKCVRCHGHKKQKGELRLDSEAAAMKGGETGTIIVPGDAAASPLYQRITLSADHEDVMPSKGDLLTPKQQKLFRDWINQGAKWN